MTDMRKVILTTEVNTVLSVEELKELQALVFGCMRSSAEGGPQRTTIKRVMKAGINHDVRGTIVQVQANVVKERAKAKRSSKKAEAASA